MWRGSYKKVYARSHKGIVENRQKQEKVNVTAFCRSFGLSRQAYYQRRDRYKQSKEQEKQIINLVQKERRKHRKMGGKKLYIRIKPDMQSLGIKCGRDKFFDILRTNGMLVRYRKRYVKTTQSKHMFFKYPNLVNDIEINRAEQVWASDITYIKTKEGFVYLYLITDVYSKQIMGWELSDNMKAINAINALKMAIRNRKYPERELIHHSDRGLQYCTPSYTDVLEKNGIEISMTQKYDPYENAVAERVNGILKTEYEIGDGFLGQKDAKKEIKYAIWLYNTDRPHMSCQGMVPAEAHHRENYELKRWPAKFSSLGYPKDEKNTIFKT